MKLKALLNLHGLFAAHFTVQAASSPRDETVGSVASAAANAGGKIDSTLSLCTAYPSRLRATETSVQTRRRLIVVSHGDGTVRVVVLVGIVLIGELRLCEQVVVGIHRRENVRILGSA